MIVIVVKDLASSCEGKKLTVPVKSSNSCIDSETFQHSLCSDDERDTRVLVILEPCRPPSLCVRSMSDRARDDQS